jgi:hypothetical protein
MIDMPDVPPQYAPVVIAQASQAKQGSATTGRTIGVCHLIENPPIPLKNAVNSLSPALSLWTYLEKRERLRLEPLTTDIYNAAKISISQGPGHGKLEDEGGGDFRYAPTPDYHGQDRATLLVEIGGFKVKVIYFFNVLRGVPGGTDEGVPQEDKKYCPKGEMWKISSISAIRTAA